MAELRTIECDWPDCKTKLTEPSFGFGFPGWGGLLGLKNEKTGSEKVCLCPEHLRQVRIFILGE